MNRKLIQKTHSRFQQSCRVKVRYHHCPAYHKKKSAEADRRCELLAPEIEGEFRPVSACVSVTVSDIPGELDALDNASL
jgi:hypothetical protein